MAEPAKISVLTDSSLIDFITPIKTPSLDHSISFDVYRAKMAMLAGRKYELLNLIKANHWETLQAYILPILTMRSKPRGIDFLAYIKKCIDNQQDTTKCSLYRYLAELYSVMVNIVLSEAYLTDNIEYEELSYD